MSGGARLRIVFWLGLILAAALLIAHARGPGGKPNGPPGHPTAVPAPKPPKEGH